MMRYSICKPICRFTVWGCLFGTRECSTNCL